MIMESGIFLKKNIGIINDDDCYIYDDKLYPVRALSPRTPAPSVILEPPSRRSANGRGIKKLPPKEMLQRLLILLA